MIENAGLVLEGGGMRGLYTAGVLDFFMDQELYFQKGFGVSAGACHGCSYFCRQPGRAYSVAVDYLDAKNYCGFGTLLRTGDYFGVEMVYRTIPQKLYKIDSGTYEKSGAELYAVVTNCETGRPEYKKLQNMYRDMDYIRASASLPLMSRIVELDGKKFLDGGITDSIPIRFAESRGLTKNVVILTQPKGYRKEPNSLYPLMKLKYRKYGAFLEAIKNRHMMYNDTTDYVWAQAQKGRAFVIAPDAPLGIGRVEKNKDKLNAIYKQGYRDAQGKLGALREFLNS